jgi:hypothetical protein
MSTKTTFKRVALVAVAALGLGVLSSVSPASATTTTGFSVNASSITLVDTSGSNSGYVVYEISLTDLAGNSTILESAESLRAEVVASTLPKLVDTTTATSDITMAWATGTEFDPATGAAATASPTAGAKTLASTTATDFENLNVASRGATTTGAATTANNIAAALLKVGTASGKAIDKGAYEIRISLYDNATPANGNVIATSVVKFTAVSTREASGAVLTAANAGLKSAGAVVGETSLNYLSATLTDANGGLVRTGNNAAPLITGTLVAGTTAATMTTGLTSSDAGAASADRKNADEVGVALNGVYGFSGSMESAANIGTNASGTFRVRYGSATATATVTFAPAVAAIHTHAVPTVSAAGLSALSAAPTWYVPTTTKAASISVFTGTSATAALTNYPVTFTVTWTNGAAGDVTPRAATPTVVYSDASGYATLNLTNNTPVNGAVATIAISGYSTTQPADQTINWVSSGRQTAISVSPASQRVATGTSTVVTATVTDRFGAPVAGVVLQPSLSTTSASYTTTPMATVVTNASGQATVTLTAGANLTSDSITFTDVAGIATASTAVTYSYRTTVDTIASFLGYYDLNESTAAASVSTPVPSTGITKADGTYLSITRDRDNSRAIALTTSTSNDMIVIRVQALTSASAGAVSRPVVATGSDGVWIRSSATGTGAASRTFVTDANGFVSMVVGSNKTGANTVTLTAGAVTTSVAFWTTNAAADARYVTLTGAATATANADAIPFTATVTDRYGNPVSGVTLTIQASGVAVMGGGSTLQTFQTNSTGTFTFTGTSLIAAGGAGTFTASAPSTGEFASTAGFSGATAIDGTVTAGRNSSSVVVTFAPGENAAAAQSQAAADAAAEATDAANAATDAANAAAEAADAATAAAQDAADAVAALSTQVSEMVNALKKQITALTNLVIKIQKKVRA